VRGSSESAIFSSSTGSGARDPPRGRISVEVLLRLLDSEDPRADRTELSPCHVEACPSLELRGRTRSGAANLVATQTDAGLAEDGQPADRVSATSHLWRGRLRRSHAGRGNYGTSPLGGDTLGHKVANFPDGAVTSGTTCTYAQGLAPPLGSILLAGAVPPSSGSRLNESHLSRTLRS